MDLVSVFCRQITTFPATFVEEAVYSPLYVFGAFVKNKVGIAGGLISRSSILFHWSSYLFLCQYHAVCIAMAL
jgi:hypothetical protein